MCATKKLRLAALAVLSALAAPAAFVVACSSDNNSNPTPVTTYDANLPPPDSSTGTQDDASAAADVAVTPGEDAAIDVREEPIVLEDAQACTASRAAAQGVSADAGCWSCTPQSKPEYLNQCAGTGVLCVKFDNARVPGYDGGAPASLN